MVLATKTVLKTVGWSFFFWDFVPFFYFKENVTKYVEKEGEEMHIIDKEIARIFEEIVQKYMEIKN